MIRGCLNLGPDANYSQGNNIMDVLDGPALTKCSETAIAAAVHAVTRNFNVGLNEYGGSWKIQPEDYLDIYFHTEENWPKFKRTRNLPLTHKQTDDVNGPFQPERIAQYHALAVRECFGAGAEFTLGASFGAVASQVVTGTAVVLCLKSPGHYIAAVCYDDSKMLIGFRDPAPVKWLQETMDSNKIKWVGVADWKNIQDFYTKVWRL